MTRPATPAEVRKYHKDQGHIVRIDNAGHVVFKRTSDDPWLEGRWVSEYRVNDEAGVYLA